MYLLLSFISLEQRLVTEYSSNSVMLKKWHEEEIRYEEVPIYLNTGDNAALISFDNFNYEFNYVNILNASLIINADDFWNMLTCLRFKFSDTSIILKWCPTEWSGIQTINISTTLERILQEKSLNGYSISPLELKMSSVYANTLTRNLKLLVTYNAPGNGEI